MPRLRSKYFGELDYSPEAVFHFPEGIPGFEERSEFVFLDQPHSKPLVFMQSLDDPDLCFLAVPVSVVCANYGLRLSGEDREHLKLPAGTIPRIGADVLCLALLTVVQGADPTVNLASPIVLNLLNRLGIQAIRDDSEYLLRHPLLPLEPGVAC